MKTENPKNIPPPTRAAATGRPAGAASPAVGASPAATGAPATPPSQTGRPGRAQSGLTGTPAVSPAGSPAPIERGRGRPGGRRQPGATRTPAAAESPMASPGAPGAPSERGRGRGRPGATPEGVALPSEAASPAASPMAPERGEGKGRPTLGDRHNMLHRLNGPLLPRPLNPQANPEDDPSVALPAPLPDSPAARVHRRQGRREEAVRSKLGLRQLHLRVHMGVEVEGKEGREHNRVGRPLVKLPLQLSVAGGNPRAERKRVR